MILAGDIGAKKSFLGIFQEDEEGEAILVFPSDGPKEDDTADYSSIDSLIETFLQQANVKEPIYAACLGISGPPDKGYITGLPWNFSEEYLCDFWVKQVWQKAACEDAKELRIVTVINSLEGIDFNGLLKSKLLHDINQPKTTTVEHPKCALMGVRDGLGEALVYWGHPPTDLHGEERYVVSFSEGGHANFAPSSNLEIELLNYLLTHPEHINEHSKVVTYQNVLSIKGMVCMYQFFKDKHGGDQNAPNGLEELINKEDFTNAAKKVMITALEKKNTSCEKAIDLFFSIYGAEAGNLALKYYALGGVYYIHGSLTPPELIGELVEKLKDTDGAFWQAFTRRAKPQIVDLLSSIPVKLVQSPNIRIYGAARRALKKKSIARIIYDGC